MLYIQQLLFAVKHLHQMGILHLDIKGNLWCLILSVVGSWRLCFLFIGKNIVVCNGGYRVKLIDFGAAYQASDAPPQRVEWTPVFAAPEVSWYIKLMLSYITR